LSLLLLDVCGSCETLRNDVSTPENPAHGHFLQADFR
jgi:hypothetical protein